MNKKDVIKLLEEIALYLEIKGENPFRIAAYRKAAQGLEKDVRSLDEITDFLTVDGIGKGTNDVIVEYVNTGTSTMLEQLKEEIPETLLPLLKLPGLGGKRVGTLYKELGITDIETLKKACLTGTIYQVKGFGKKTVENILKALDEMGQRPERLPIYYMLQLVEEIKQYLREIPEINRFSVAGSIRRLSETIKDIDFVIDTDDAETVKAKLLQMENIKEVINQGDTKISYVLGDEYAVSVDFLIVDENAYASSLHHFTGSKEHNVKMRQLAKARKEKINEYGVTNLETGERKHFETEEAFFNHFHLNFIPPELREGKDELERFKEHVNLVRDEQIKGDLHMHTTWSDGAHSIEEMVNAAREKGYQYIAITDHSKFLRVANGLDEKRLLKQREEIERLRQKYPDIHILHGVEMDILPNGTLDFSDDFLKEMDWVIAAIHSGFNQSREEIMKRLKTACENPYVDLIAHPTGRLIGRRSGYDVDVEALIEMASETNTALELNANPMRLDLAPEWLDKAQEKNIPIAVNTDSHQTSTLAFMQYGLQVARKAYLQPETVMNTWDVEAIIRFSNRNK